MSQQQTLEYLANVFRVINSPGEDDSAVKFSKCQQCGHLPNIEKIRQETLVDLKKIEFDRDWLDYNFCHLGNDLKNSLTLNQRLIYFLSS